MGRAFGQKRKIKDADEARIVLRRGGRGITLRGPRALLQEAVDSAKAKADRTTTKSLSEDPRYAKRQARIDAAEAAKAAKAKKKADDTRTYDKKMAQAQAIRDPVRRRRAIIAAERWGDKHGVT